MRYRQKKNGMWLVDYDDHGKRRRVSTGIKTAPMKREPQEVRDAAREIVLGIRTLKFTPASVTRKSGDGRLTMSDLFDKAEATVWHPDNARSQATIRSNLKILRAKIGDVAAEDMTFQRLQDLIQEFKGEGYAPATIKRKLDMVSKALRMATMWSDDKGRPLLAYKPPMPRIAVNNLKDRVISPAEQDAIFVAVEKRRQTEPNRQWFRFAALLRVMFATGGRLGEVLGTGPANLTQMGGQTYVTFPRYRTKNGKPRSIPLTPDAVEAFGGLMDHLVLDKKSKEWRFFGITNGTAWYMFDQVRQDVTRETGLNLADVTLHTIRHTTLTRLAQGGMSLAALQEFAGHSDPKITAERYIHLMPSDLVGALAILAGSNNTLAANSAAIPVKPAKGSDPFIGANSATAGTPRLQ